MSAEGGGDASGTAASAAGDSTSLLPYALALAAVVAAWLWYRSRANRTAQQRANEDLLKELATETQAKGTNSKEAKAQELKDAAAIAKYQFSFRDEREKLEALKDKYKAELSAVASANHEKRVARDRAVAEAKQKAADAKAAAEKEKVAAAAADGKAAPNGDAAAMGAGSKATVEVVDDEEDGAVEATSKSGAVSVQSVKPKAKGSAASAKPTSPAAAPAPAPTTAAPAVDLTPPVVTAADGTDPVKAVGAALLRQTMAVVSKAMVLNADGAEINRSRRAGFCPDAVFHAYSEAVQRVNEEIELIKNEAEDLRVGWGEGIFQQAHQLVQLQRHQQLKEQKAKAAEQKKRDDEAKAKADAAEAERKRQADVAQAKRDSEAAFKELMRGEDKKAAKKKKPAAAAAGAGAAAGVAAGAGAALTPKAAPVPAPAESAAAGGAAKKKAAAAPAAAPAGASTAAPSGAGAAKKKKTPKA